MPSDLQYYYFVHPEGCSAWKLLITREEFERMEHDPTVEIVDKDTYMKACAAWGEEP